MLDEDASLSSMNRRDILFGVPLVTALASLPATPNNHRSTDPDDDDAFLMINGWIFRREDLAG